MFQNETFDCLKFVLREGWKPAGFGFFASVMILLRFRHFTMMDLERKKAEREVPALVASFIVECGACNATARPGAANLCFLGLVVLWLVMELWCCFSKRRGTLFYKKFQFA